MKPKPNRLTVELVELHFVVILNTNRYKQSYKGEPKNEF